VTAGGGVDEILARLPREASVAALLARADIDLVSICTPTDTHVDLVRAAIAARKHVLVEKPTALDANAIDALAREADAAGVLAMPAHCMRFWPAWAWMAKAVREQRYGRVKRALFRRLGARPAWSQDFYLDVARSGGAAIDLHIHDADFVRFCFGEPSDVHASGSRMHVHAKYRYSDGLIVEAEGAWFDNPNFSFTMTARIECERGTLDFSIGRVPELTVTEASVESTIVAGRDYPIGNGYDAEVSELLAAIQSGARIAPVTLFDAAATQRLLDREMSALE